MSPWALLLAAAAAGGAYWQGRQDGRGAVEAEAARDERLVAQAGQASATAAAEAIARMSVRHTTIRQEVEREIQVRTEYRDCRHSAEQLQRINAALGPAAAGSAAGGGAVLAVQGGGAGGRAEVVPGCAGLCQSCADVRPLSACGGAVSR